MLMVVLDFCFAFTFSLPPSAAAISSPYSLPFHFRCRLLMLRYYIFHAAARCFFFWCAIRADAMLCERAAWRMPRGMRAAASCACAYFALMRACACHFTQSAAMRQALQRRRRYDFFDVKSLFLFLLFLHADYFADVMMLCYAAVDGASALRRLFFSLIRLMSRLMLFSFWFFFFRRRDNITPRFSSLSSLDYCRCCQRHFAAFVIFAMLILRYAFASPYIYFSISTFLRHWCHFADAIFVTFIIYFFFWLFALIIWFFFHLLIFRLMLFSAFSFRLMRLFSFRFSPPS